MPRFRVVKKEKEVNTAKRVYAVGGIFACAFGLLFCRAVSFHMKDNAELEKVALRQYRTAIHQSSKRGKIFDSAGRELAIDLAVDSVYASPKEMEEPVDTSLKLSKALKIDRGKLLDKLSTGRKFAWVKRRVNEREAQAVKDLNIKGIYLMRENGRFYPGQSLASTILGTVGYDSEPLAGIELEYNDVIAASKLMRDVQRDARGHLYLSASEMSDDLKLANLELTIDRTLQFITERELSSAVKRARAKGGSAVVVDVRNGELLAMANVPSFDPNSYEKFDISNWRNRSISDAYEPGSTFKTIIVASAIDRGVVTPADVFDCENGNLRIGSKVVRDAHPHGKLSVADIIKVSSNIGAYKVEKQLGPARAYDAIRAFGFGEPSGIDLPGESAGILSPHEKWSELQFATIAFGQGIAATPLQIAMAFAAIANGGNLHRPHIVKRIVGDNKETLFNAKPEIVNRPISEAAAKTMTELLTRVTQKGGTGTMAASREYPIAGKTGTAQKANPRTGGYAAGKYYSSFVGFAPADAPRIAVFVGIDEPGGGMYYGGQVAAPVFREIIDATLHYLKVPGRLIAADENKTPSAKSNEDEIADVVADDSEPKKFVQDGGETVVMPDLRGLTIRGVLQAAKGADIAWRFRGSGVAVKQLPPPGFVVRSGAQCNVEFEPRM